MVFNFDEWASLAKQDCIAFEQKRAATLQQYITAHAKTTDDLRRLNGLQFRVDMIRRKHKTPLAACIAISKLLMDHVYQLANPDLALTANREKRRTNGKLLTFPSIKK